MIDRLVGQRTSVTGEIEPWEEPLTNPWRERAQGHKVISMPYWLYCDDTSGNRSKKWNEHNSFLMTPAGIPRQEAQGDSGIQFLCTSNAAPPLEMMDGVVTEFECVSVTFISLHLYLIQW